MEKLVRLKGPHPQCELNLGGRYFLSHVDGFHYVPDTEDNRLHIEAATKVGGFARVDYPQFEHKVFAAIHALTDALDGAEQQTILDAVECVLQSFDADVERLWPAV
jgi:hypothetical protein